MFKCTLEVIEGCPYFKMHALEVVHDIGDLGWREVVLEDRLDICQRFLVGWQSDRL